MVAMADEEELRIAWHAHVAVGPDADGELDEVIGRHRQPHRRYHSVRHVTWVVRHVLDIAGSEPVADLGALVAAAVYHDAVYDPAAADNEERSAVWATRALRELGWAHPRADDVGDLVRATRTHDAAAGTDAAVLVDADLAVLGSDPAAYQAYVTGVRHEYAAVPADAWRTGRADVLRSFLDRPAIFRTPTGHARWQARARANLAAELATF